MIALVVLGCSVGWRPREIKSADSAPTIVMSDQNRDVLTPREVAERSGFSYHAILRAIRRGDLQAFEPVVGHYRIEVAEYEGWLRTPTRRADREPSDAGPRRRTTATASSDRRSLAAL